jgi:hypothetical protein
MVKENEKEKKNNFKLILTLKRRRRKKEKLSHFPFAPLRPFSLHTCMGLKRPTTQLAFLSK